MNGPGVYLDVPFAEYLNAPAVNAGLLQCIVERCPAAAFYSSWLNPERVPEQSSATMDAGSIAHALLLEGSNARVTVIDPNQYPSKTTGAIPEGWTNKDIRMARDAAHAAGKLPILKPAFAAIEAMVDAAREYIDSLRHSEPAIYAAFQPGGGDSEVSMLWDDDGTLCRLRADRINTDRTLIVDYKTGDTSAEPNTWGRVQMVRMSYYQGAAFYRRGVRAACKLGHGRFDYVYLVQEREPPYLCSLVGIDGEGFHLGDEKIEYGLSLWRKCARAKVWPAYPPRVLYPVIPTWEVARWEEFESLGIPYDPAKMWGKSEGPHV